MVARAPYGRRSKGWVEQVPQGGRPCGTPGLFEQRVREVRSGGHLSGEVGDEALPLRLAGHEVTRDVVAVVVLVDEALIVGPPCLRNIKGGIELRKERQRHLRPIGSVRPEQAEKYSVCHDAFRLDAPRVEKRCLHVRARRISNSCMGEAIPGSEPKLPCTSSVAALLMLNQECEHGYRQLPK